MAEEIEKKPAARLEDLERRLTVLEEKLFAVLLTSTRDEDLVTVRAEADRDLARTAVKCLAPRSTCYTSNTFTSACWKNIVFRA